MDQDIDREREGERVPVHCRESDKVRDSDSESRDGVGGGVSVSDKLRVSERIQLRVVVVDGVLLCDRVSDGELEELLVPNVRVDDLDSDDVKVGDEDSDDVCERDVVRDSVGVSVEDNERSRVADQVLDAVELLVCEVEVDDESDRA